MAHLEPEHEDLTAAWQEAQARLPPGWMLDSLRCASTGLAAGQRSDDWIAVALGPGGQQRQHRASDPVSALGGLVASLSTSAGA